LLGKRFAEHWGSRAALRAPPEEPPRPADVRDEVLILDPAFVEAIVAKLLAARTGRSDPTAGAERVSRFADSGARRREEEP
jgi:hypothetical protein